MFSMALWTEAAPDAPDTRPDPRVPPEAERPPGLEFRGVKGCGAATTLFVWRPKADREVVVDEDAANEDEAAGAAATAANYGGEDEEPLAMRLKLLADSEVGPARSCSPYHRMLCNSKARGSNCVSMTWRVIFACHFSEEAKRSEGKPPKIDKEEKRRVKEEKRRAKEEAKLEKQRVKREKAEAKLAKKRKREPSADVIVADLVVPKKAGFKLNMLATPWHPRVSTPSAHPNPILCFEVKRHPVT